MQRKSSIMGWNTVIEELPLTEFWFIYLQHSSMQLCSLPAEAEGCSCGGPKWVEVLLASLCLERQTAPCT